MVTNVTLASDIFAWQLGTDPAEVTSPAGVAVSRAWESITATEPAPASRNVNVTLKANSRRNRGDFYTVSVPLSRVFSFVGRLLDDPSVFEITVSDAEVNVNYKVEPKDFGPPAINPHFSNALKLSDLFPGKAVRIHHTMRGGTRGAPFSRVAIIDRIVGEWVWVTEERKSAWHASLGGPKLEKRSLADMGVIPYAKTWNESNYTTEV